MANKVNYQKELDKIITAHEKAGEVPSVFLHSCCAPCSSYCLEYLSRYFSITDFYYNPNITDEAEYRKREEELAKLIRICTKYNSFAESMSRVGFSGLPADWKTVPRAGSDVSDVMSCGSVKRPGWLLGEDMITLLPRLP